MSDEIYKIVDKLFDDNPIVPEGFELKSGSRDNSQGNAQIIPEDAKSWDEVEEVIITHNVDEEVRHTFKRKK